MIDNKFVNCVKLCPEELMDLREEIRNCRKCVVSLDESNNSKRKTSLENQFDDKSREPVTTNYWSDACFNIPADLLIIGQDWGSVDMLLTSRR